MADRPIRLAVIAGEESGDNLGADLVQALKTVSGRDVELVGVGGAGLIAHGLKPLFESSEIALMGFTAVIAKLPRLAMLIRQTAAAIVAARPDCLVIVDNPDFTHRVARRVKAKLPGLPVINYVSPTVWAWRPERAKKMQGYVDHVLAILPFEPKALAELDGPPSTYVGHPLASSENVGAARARQESRKRDKSLSTLLLLPGSRKSEVKALMGAFGETVGILANRGRNWHFVIPAAAHVEALIQDSVRSWTVKPEVVTSAKAKWRAIGEADAALAASGTVLLELALTGVPVLSTYKTDALVRLAFSMVTVWSGALPNLIADYPAVPEYYDRYVRPERLARELERLASDTPERFAQLAGFGHVRAAMATAKPPGNMAARIVLDHIRDE